MRKVMLAVLIVFILALAAIGASASADRIIQIMAARRPAAMPSAIVISGYYPLRITQIQPPGPRWGGSGAIDDSDFGLIFASREGGLSLLDESRQRFAPIAVPAPFKFSEVQLINGKKHEFTVGLKDVLSIRRGDTLELFVSHHHRRANAACYVLRLSSIRLVRDAAHVIRASGPWKVVFESTPCIDESEGNFPMEAGGRIAALDDRTLLLTVGDHAYGRFTKVQDTTASYGKVMRIDLETNQSRIFTVGHRNPQGITVDKSGAAWLTEHGPRGGDELNALEVGGNYGWPLRTYGTNYETFSWEQDSDATEGSHFVEPAFSWTPSVGITSVTSLQGQIFKRWRGDLLAGSLNGRALFRLRLRDGRVVNMERIEMPRRIREVIERRDGTLAALGDSDDSGDRGRLLLIAPALGINSPRTH
jgi:hypothetical protein